jgi:hypothetical protein
MSERIFNNFEKANMFASLMKKMSGQEFAVVQQEGHWVVRPNFGSKSIVDVTEELLRQIGK